MPRAKSKRKSLSVIHSKSKKRNCIDPSPRPIKRKRLVLSDDEKDESEASEIRGKIRKLSLDPNFISRALHRIGLSLITTEKCEKLRGREEEHKTVEDFLKSHLQSRKGGCLYIAGSPGTGKSALLHNLMNVELITWKAKKKFPEYHVIHFKATICATVNDVYPTLLQKISGALGLTHKVGNAHEAKDKLSEIILTKKKKKKTMLVVVIDEVDALLSGSKGQKFSQRVLYHLFGLPSKRNSSLILIGIANSIDLSQRFLPLLEKRGCGPQLLVFEPYTEKQLITIMEEKLGTDGQEMFTKNALRLCAKKVSSMKGDCRQCLLLCRQALQLLEENKKIKVDFPEMQTVLQSLQNPMIKRLSKLVFEQKKVLTVTAIMFRQRAKYTRAEIRSFYKHTMKMTNLPGLHEKTFTEVLDTLVTLGFFTASHKKIQSMEFQMLQLNVLESDLASAVEDTRCLKELLTTKVTVPARFLTENSNAGKKEKSLKQKNVKS